MQIAQMLLDQLEREAGPTRRALERVPDGRSDWKPHPKSMPLGYLSFLVGAMFGWIARIVESEFLDLAAGGAPPSEGSAAERLALFDKAVADARRALSAVTEEELMKPWQLRVSGKVVDEKPRYAMIADTISHMAHHRGQLTVYLRLNDQPVPSIYGPTADESWQAP
ncbi:MAG TPA: DinB family protein [Thermoanaerobaculia bacterium]|nr:DinB family protein [Thermoanaerobaculia bacterium]